MFLLFAFAFNLLTGCMEHQTKSYAAESSLTLSHNETNAPKRGKAYTQVLRNSIANKPPLAQRGLYKYVDQLLHYYKHEILDSTEEIKKKSNKPSEGVIKAKTQDKDIFIDAPGQDVFYMLHAVIYKQNIDLLKSLFTTKNINHIAQYATQKHRTYIQKQLETGEVPIESKTYNLQNLLTIKDRFGRTPLEVCFDLDVKWEVIETLFTLAAQTKHLKHHELVNDTILHAAVYHKYKYLQKLIHYLKENLGEQCINAIDQLNQDTPLFLAVKTGNTVAFNLLFDDANLKHINKYQQTLLHIVCLHRNAFDNPKDHQDILRNLFNKKPHLMRVQLEFENSFKEKPWEIAFFHLPLEKIKGLEQYVRFELREEALLRSRSEVNHKKRAYKKVNKHFQANNKDYSVDLADREAFIEQREAEKASDTKRARTSLF